MEAIIKIVAVLFWIAIGVLGAVAFLALVNERLADVGSVF